MLGFLNYSNASTILGLQACFFIGYIVIAGLYLILQHADHLYTLLFSLIYQLQILRTINL